MWDVEYTNEFHEWWQGLTEAEQDDLTASIGLLQQNGPSLGRPYADTLKGSRHPNMKELRTQCLGRPLRTFFAFEPRRCAILLIGGEKTGKKRFYNDFIPIADRLYDDYLRELRDEGLI